VIKYCIVVCRFEEPGPLETAGRTLQPGSVSFVPFFYSPDYFRLLNHLYTYMRKAAGKLTGGDKKKS